MAADQDGNRRPVRRFAVYDTERDDGPGGRRTTPAAQAFAAAQLFNVPQAAPNAAVAQRMSAAPANPFQVAGGTAGGAFAYPGQAAYAGVNSNVFIKRTKTKLQTIEDQKINIEYNPVNKYFVRNEFGTFHITGKKTFKEAYQNSEQIISILKKYRIKLSKKNIEQGLVAAASYLESDIAIP
jgi:hypothetical protein